MKILSTRLLLLIVWTIFGMPAQALVITDKEGRSIKAEILVFADDTITVRREDGKIFEMRLDSLSEGSLKEIATLKKLDARKELPVEKTISFENVEIKVYLPKGEYNLPEDRAAIGNIHSDHGWICIRPNSKPGGIDRCKEMAEARLKEFLGRLRPTERKEAEKAAKISEVSYGIYKGYRIKGVFLNYGFFTDGITVFSVTQSIPKSGAGFSQKNLPMIIRCLEILRR